MENKPSIGDWMLWMLIGAIPVIGFIMIIMWSLDSGNEIRKNWAAATLIWILITVVVMFFFWGIIIAIASQAGA